jgi:CubicO group peptidase (beta-lactamase class C family)
VLGLVVEVAGGRPFSEFCVREIFGPLDMSATSFEPWTTGAQAVLYTLATTQGERVVREDRRSPVVWRGARYIANCRYAFPNFPDGLLRTSVRQFARFVRALLRPGAADEMFRAQMPEASRPASWPAAQGLAWYAVEGPRGLIWLHTGADPGVRTVAMCSPRRRIAALLFANTAPAEGLPELAGACLRRAARQP